MKIFFKRPEDYSRLYPKIDKIKNTVKIGKSEVELARDMFIPNLEKGYFYKVGGMRDVLYRDADCHIICRKNRVKIFILDKAFRIPSIMYKFNIKQKLLRDDLRKIMIQITNVPIVPEKMFNEDLDPDIQNLIDIKYKPLKKVYDNNPGNKKMMLAYDYFAEKRDTVVDVQHYLLMNSIQTLMVQKYLDPNFNIWKDSAYMKTLEVKEVKYDLETIVYVPEEELPVKEKKQTNKLI